MMYMTNLVEELLMTLHSEECACIDRSEYNDELELENGSFEIQAYLRGKFGICYPISIVREEESEDIDFRFILFNENKVNHKQLIDLCNYIMAHYVYLRWSVHGEEGDVCANYTMTMAEDEAENIPRVMHHLSIFVQVLDEIYPLVQRTLWEDSYE